MKVTRQGRGAAYIALLGVCCHTSPVWGSELRLDIADCPALNPTATRELFAVELRTLGVAETSPLTVSIRCHGQRATLRLREASESSHALAATARRGETSALTHEQRAMSLPNETSESIHDLSSMDVDLSSTDEAAWPRLIALSASELVEQSLRSSPIALVPERDSLPRIEVVSFDARTPRRPRFLPFVGLTLGRLGDPGTWLTGLTLGTELRVRRIALFGTDLRGQWGSNALTDANVTWQLISVAAYGGLVIDFGPVELSASGGLRVGRLALEGQAKSADASGRELVGPTGGPLIAVRLRAPVGRGLFAGVTLEEGYSLWSVRGNYGQRAPLLVVDGTWSSAVLGFGWAF